MPQAKDNMKEVNGTRKNIDHINIKNYNNCSSEERIKSNISTPREDESYSPNPQNPHHHQSYKRTKGHENPNSSITRTHSTIPIQWLDQIKSANSAFDLSHSGECLQRGLNHLPPRNITEEISFSLSGKQLDSPLDFSTKNLKLEERPEIVTTERLRLEMISPTDLVKTGAVLNLSKESSNSALSETASTASPNYSPHSPSMQNSDLESNISMTSLPLYSTDHEIIPELVGRVGLSNRVPHNTGPLYTFNRGSIGLIDQNITTLLNQSPLSSRPVLATSMESKTPIFFPYPSALANMGSVGLSLHPSTQLSLSANGTSSPTKEPSEVYQKDVLTFPIPEVSLPGFQMGLVPGITEAALTEKSNKEYEKFRERKLASSKGIRTRNRKSLQKGSKRGSDSFNDDFSSQGIYTENDVDLDDTASEDAMSNGNLPMEQTRPREDPTYRERREKNNLAAKKSRAAKRAKELENAIRVQFLEEENLRLRYQMHALINSQTNLRYFLGNKSA